MAHADYTRAIEKPLHASLAELVREYREHGVALRRLAKSTPTRNAGATQHAIAWRTARLRVIEGSLVLAEHRVLAGELVEERALLERIADAKAHNIVRPELHVRLRTVRSRIRILAN